MRRFPYLMIAVISLGIGVKAYSGEYYAVGSSSCPSFHNAANVIFSWDGDHASGTNYACDSSGTAIQGTNSNLTIGTSYGESGSNGARLEDVDKYLTWADSGDQYIDDDAPQTIWIRVYPSARPDADTSIFESIFDGDNYIYLYSNDSTDALVCYYEAAGALDSAYGNSYANTGAWQDIAYSWDQANGDHSAYSGAGWDDDDDELGDVMAANLDDITIGENASGGGDPGAGKYINIDKFAILSGYKTACPW